MGGRGGGVARSSLTHKPTQTYRVRRLYNLYTDFVLKNPFYELDMPIRCELFDLHLTEEVDKLRAD